MTLGLAIGKFYPPHKGHKFLIETALAGADEVVVAVCEKPEQRLSGELRASWLREMAPRARVMVVPDIHPDDDSAAWARYTIEFLGRAPDLVFTSEDYGGTYCAILGARHVMVDRARVAVPISATRVRADPIACWEWLEPCVRAHFARRVVVVGAESTGTTTLAQSLSAHYSTPCVPEFGRLYSEAKLPAPDGSQWRSEEFDFIAKEQNRIEDALARACNRLLVCDTDSFATAIWHERYMGFPSTEVASLAAGRRRDLYLLTGDEIPFAQDGTRDGEHIRHWMHGCFEEGLRRGAAPWLLLRGTREERLRAAIGACDKMLAAPSPV